jgi:osmotically-inducible protein OsmY
MSNQSITRQVIVLLTLAFVLLAGVFAAQSNKKPAKPAPPKVDCSAVTDADIVKAIQDKIKANPKFKKQLKLINVSSTDKAVILDGRVIDKAAIATIGKYANSAKCVLSVKNNIGLGANRPVSASCGPGQKICGEICIDEKAECNIMN